MVRKEKEDELEDVLNDSGQNTRDLRAGKVAKHTWQFNSDKFREEERSVKESGNEALHDGLDNIAALKRLISAQEIVIPGAKPPAKRHHRKVHHKAHRKVHRKKHRKR